ncbi:MAG: threonine synthase [Nitrospinota bacterium]
MANPAPKEALPVSPEPRLLCLKCGSSHSHKEPLWRCPCGGLLEVEMEARFPWEAISRRPPSLWRYREALPIESDPPVTLGEGMTPLIPWKLLGREVLLKLDYLFPTGSFKDRGASVLITKVKELGIGEVLGDSSGNAGAAIAAYSARAGVRCRMYVPQGTSPEKVAQITAYGASVIEIPGGRQKTAEAALKAAGSTFFASHYWNPYFFEGTKTFAFEAFEQLGGRLPDAFVVPAGNGTLLLGLWKGVRELLRAGAIERVPRVFALQAEACAPLVRAFEEGEEEVREVPAGDTLAEGIKVPLPVRGSQMLGALRESKGGALSVAEEEILPALRALASEGLFVEPTSAIAVAGARLLLERGLIGEGEDVLIPLTGHGLKASAKLKTLL